LHPWFLVRLIRIPAVNPKFLVAGGLRLGRSRSYVKIAYLEVIVDKNINTLCNSAARHNQVKLEKFRRSNFF
jgi:hypothetical protein